MTDRDQDDYTTAHERLYAGADDNAARADGAPSDDIRSDDGRDRSDIEQELEFEDGNEPLPWLESSDYEDDGGTDTARVVGFVLLGLLALALLVGGIWWLTQRGPDPDMVADGSVIEAPQGDYKERPDDPGGKEFAGTGDVAPAVAEGQSREARLAEGNRAAQGQGASDRPNEGQGRTAADAQQSAQASAAQSGSTSGVPVQVGAYSSRASAETGWQTLSRQTDALGGVNYRIVEATVDGRTVYRLQAMPGGGAAADRLCNALKDDGLACQVKR